MYHSRDVLRRQMACMRCSRLPAAVAVQVCVNPSVPDSTRLLLLLAILAGSFESGRNAGVRCDAEVEETFQYRFMSLIFIVYHSV